MGKRFFRGLGQFGLGLLLAVLVTVLWQTAVFAQSPAQSPAQIRVAQFISDAHLSVQIQPQSGTQSDIQSGTQSGAEPAVVLSDLPYRQISDYQSLPAGRYVLTVRADEHILLRATYGLGGGDRYTLALSGILPEQPEPNPHTFIAQLRHILGGVDAHAVNGYLPQMLMLHDKISSQSAAPLVRLIHLAPGIMPLQIGIQGQSKSLLSKPLAYPNVSEAASVKGETTAVAIAIEGSPTTVSHLPLQLQPQTLTDIFAIGGLNAPHPLEIVVANTLGE